MGKIRPNAESRDDTRTLKDSHSIENVKRVNPVLPLGRKSGSDTRHLLFVTETHLIFHLCHSMWKSTVLHRVMRQFRSFQKRNCVYSSPPATACILARACTRSKNIVVVADYSALGAGDGHWRGATERLIFANYHCCATSWCKEVPQRYANGAVWTNTALLALEDTRRQKI